MFNFFILKQIFIRLPDPQIVQGVYWGLQASVVFYSILNASFLLRLFASWTRNSTSSSCQSDLWMISGGIERGILRSMALSYRSSAITLWEKPQAPGAAIALVSVKHPTTGLLQSGSLESPLFLAAGHFCPENELSEQIASLRKTRTTATRLYQCINCDHEMTAN